MNKFSMGILSSPNAAKWEEGKSTYFKPLTCKRQTYQSCAREQGIEEAYSSEYPTYAYYPDY